MDSTIDKNFENRCIDRIRQEILKLSEGERGQIFLFGSRATGHFRRGSDIDIGFAGMDDDKYNSIRIKMDLFWEDSFVPYHLDLVNFDNVRNDFRKKAMETIEIWKKH